MNENIIAQTIIVDGGKDCTNKQILVAYGCYFPSPEETDYDLLLEEFMQRLTHLTNGEYILIFFASPMSHQPSFTWMKKAYYGLERKYKKNIKKVYIVHTTKWFRFLLWIMKNIFSDKLARKIETFECLDNLSKIIPLDNIFIPPIVNGHDKGFTPILDNELPSVRVFNAPIEKSAPSGEIPSPILHVAKLIEEKGLNEKDLFRLNPDKIAVEEVKRIMNVNYKVEADLLKYSPHVLASAFKEYFRSIKEPLIREDLYCNFGDIIETADDYDRRTMIKRRILSEMGDQRCEMLSMVIRLLRKVSNRVTINGMSVAILASIWTPNIIWCEDPLEEMSLLKSSKKFIEILIENSDDLF